MLTASRLNAIFIGFNASFKEGLQGSATPLGDAMLETNSTSEEEAYEWLNTIGGLAEFTGEGKFDDLTSSGYRIKNREYQRGVSVKAINIARDREGIYKPSFQMLGQRANSHKDELGAELLLGGFAQKDYTGKNFFDADKLHAPNVKGGKAPNPTFSNKGTKKISAANFETAFLNISARLDREGKPLRLGKKLRLFVGSNSYATARDIVETKTLAAGGDNPNYGKAELVLMPEIDASATPYAWFLLECGMPVKSLIFQNEIAPRLESQTSPDSDVVFENKIYRYQAYASRGAGYGLPQLAYGSTGADAA